MASNWRKWGSMIKADDEGVCRQVLVSEVKPLGKMHYSLKRLVAVNPPRIMAYLKEELRKVRDVRVRWYGLFLIACMVCNKGLIEEILREVKYEGNELIEPLCEVSKNGNVELVELFLSKGAPVNGKRSDCTRRVYCMEHTLDLSSWVLHVLVKEPSRGVERHTPLEIAISHGQLEVVKVLLSHGAGANQVDRYGKSPLQQASLKGDLEIVKILLSNRVDVNLGNEDESSPLHYALSEGHVEVVKVLLSHGADVNGWGLLHKASRSGNVELVQALISHGADVSLMNRLGTPLSIAIEHNHRGVVDLLISEGAKLLPYDLIDHTAFIIGETS